MIGPARLRWFNHAWWMGPTPDIRWAPPLYDLPATSSPANLWHLAGKSTDSVIHVSNRKRVGHPLRGHAKDKDIPGGNGMEEFH
ncbi:hypothetical protein AMTR_s00019p00190310 [Amborella trichopoda]|uniref:Uncharacterized protein n=1 Tax=Amborella trichopoda TaxID=13333 RepID=W1PBG4_AMBTC|nr:hypothetical protein AMTR_s00019p00190310 [Amborella trichopoda]